jgi:hypothetical protein
LLNMKIQLNQRYNCSAKENMDVEDVGVRSKIEMNS